VKSIPIHPQATIYGLKSRNNLGGKKMPKSKKELQANRRNHRGCRCVFCGSTENLSKHHIIHKRFGGSNDEENIVIICETCHILLHKLTDLLLNYLVETGQLHKHKILPPKK